MWSMGKKHNRKAFLKGEDGTVSVYLIMIIVPIFLMQSLMVDLARIRLGERELEIALKASLRSAMSAFHPELQRYGLFAMELKDGSQQEDRPTLPEEEDESSFGIYRSAIFGNLLISNKGFQLLDHRLSSIRLTGLKSLANQIALKQQIMQEMKYRAPVAFGLEIVDKFKKGSLANTLQASNHMQEHAKEMEEFIQVREEHLDDAWRKALVLIRFTAAESIRNQEDIEALKLLAEQSGAAGVENLRKLVEQSKQDIAAMKDQVKELKEKVDTATLQGVADQAMVLQQDLEDLQNQLSAKVKEEMDLGDKLKKAGEYMLMLQTAMMKAQAAAKQANDQAKLVLDSINLAQKANDQLTALAEEGKSKLSAGESDSIYQAVLAYPFQYFVEYRSQVGKTAAFMQSFDVVWSKSQLVAGDPLVQLQEANERMRLQGEEFRSIWEGKEAERDSRSQQTMSEKRKQQKKLDGAVDELNKVLQGCGAGDRASESLYKQLEGDREKNEKGSL